jgi:hypothetical protein
MFIGQCLARMADRVLGTSMTATPSRDNELNGVQILLEAFATECEAIAIEQSPNQINDIQTASGDARLPLTRSY